MGAFCFFPVEDVAFLATHGGPNSILCRAGGRSCEKIRNGMISGLIGVALTESLVRRFQIGELEFRWPGRMI